VRYYYNDALKAAWMAREFGVKFQWPSGDKLYDYGSDWRNFTANFLYIHPDSLHILEPQVGDLWRVIAKNSGRADTDRNPPDVIYHITDTHFWRVGKELSPKLGGEGKLRARYKFCKIIQRNGAAFFMPEVEP